MADKKDEQEDTGNHDLGEPTPKDEWENYSGPANSVYIPEEYDPNNPNHKASSFEDPTVKNQPTSNLRRDISDNGEGESLSESTEENGRQQGKNDAATSKDSGNDNLGDVDPARHELGLGEADSGTQTEAVGGTRPTSNSATNTSGGKGCGSAVIGLVVLAVLGGIFVVNHLGKHESKSPDPVTVEETTTVMHTETETEMTQEPEPVFSPPSQASYVGTSSSYKIYKWGKTSDEFAEAVGSEMDGARGSMSDHSPSVYSSVTGQTYTIRCESQRGKGWYCYTDTNANVALVNR